MCVSVCASAHVVSSFVYLFFKCGIRFFRIHFDEFVQACVYKMCVRLYFCMCLLLLRTVSVLMHC